MDNAYNGTTCVVLFDIVMKWDFFFIHRNTISWTLPQEYTLIGLMEGWNLGWQLCCNIINIIDFLAFQYNDATHLTAHVKIVILHTDKNQSGWMLPQPEAGHKNVRYAHYVFHTMSNKSIQDTNVYDTLTTDWSFWHYLLTLQLPSWNKTLGQCWATTGQCWSSEAQC